MVVPASPSSRRAWIEIIVEELEPGADDVALLAEGVDRNVKLKRWHERQRVALFAEGVDRNGLLVDCLVKPEQSPSSRRAWIEIQPDTSSHCAAPVALLAEGVDRNLRRLCQCLGC